MQKPATNEQRGAPLATVFVLMRTEFGEAVAERALRYRPKASPGARRSLEQAARSGVQVRGFRDASKAKPQHLSGPVLGEIIRGNGQLAAATLRVWDESQAELRTRVTEHLSAAGVPPAGPDYERNRFAATWPMDEWVRHRETLASDHPEFNEDEVALMLCLVAGRAPMPEVDEAVARIESDFLRGFLDQLIELSPESPDWTDIDAFTATASKIATEKSKEQVESQTRAVADAIDHIQEKYRGEVKYLDLDVQFWFAQVKRRRDLVPEALDLLGRLTKELEAYRPIRPQGSSREEERRRAKPRADRESAILDMAKEWERITAKPSRPVAEVAEQRAVLAVGRQETPDEELDAMRSERDQLQADCERLGSERDRLHDANDGLRLEKDQLKAELDDFKEELALSKTSAEYWREQYEAEKARVDGDNPAAPADLASVAAAVARAEKEFAGQLLFALNNKSSIDMPFQKPQEVFEVFSWLATEFHRQRPGDAKTDLTLSIKEACPGWFYKPNQTKTTMGMFSDWYRTTVSGKTYELSNHVGKGNSFDPRSTIRIAFAWDDEKAQAVVGYVGTHQRNRQS